MAIIINWGWVLELVEVNVALIFKAFLSLRFIRLILVGNLKELMSVPIRSCLELMMKWVLFEIMIFIIRNFAFTCI